MKIVVVVKNVYGNSLIYPVCDNAKSFSNLTGKKTLSSYAIRLIEEWKARNKNYEQVHLGEIDG